MFFIEVLVNKCRQHRINLARQSLSDEKNWEGGGRAGEHDGLTLREGEGEGRKASGRRAPLQCVPGEYEGQHCLSEEPHKPPEILTCLSGPVALQPAWEQCGLSMTTMMDFRASSGQLYSPWLEI